MNLLKETKNVIKLSLEFKKITRIPNNMANDFSILVSPKILPLTLSHLTFFCLLNYSFAGIQPNDVMLDMQTYLPKREKFQEKPLKGNNSLGSSSRKLNIEL